MLKKIFMLILILISANALAEPTPHKLTLALDWYVNPDHATIFVAQDQGFFKEQGLDVSLITPSDWTDPPKLVAANQADIAITYEPEFIDQVEQGLPLVSFGTLVDKPLNCLLVLAGGDIKSIQDLKHKRIGGSTGGALAIMLKTMLQKNHIKPNEVELINVRNNTIQALLAGRVDAVTGVMRNIEPQIDLSDYTPLIFLPEHEGVPTYSELIFVTNKSSLENPEQRLALQHFLAALEKAAAYLRKHPEESWQRFGQKYPALNNPFNRRAWYATLPYFSTHPKHLSQEEWRAFIAFLRQNELIKSQHSLSDYITEITA